MESTGTTGDEERGEGRQSLAAPVFGVDPVATEHVTDAVLAYAAVVALIAGLVVALCV